jgi:lipid A 4'-phosphatase
MDPSMGGFVRVWSSVSARGPALKARPPIPVQGFASTAVRCASSAWGRARPARIEECGGERQFTPALVIAGECERNCAFTSGRAAIAFYLMVLAFLLKGTWRRVAFSGAVLYGVAVGLVRIVQGGHFLSDVVFSFIIVYLVSAALYRLVVGVRRQE